MQHIAFIRTIKQDVDDPHNFLANMINEDYLNTIADHQALPHQLKLKVDDICILMRHVNKEKGYTNNRGVTIVAIRDKVIQVRTLDSTDPNNDEFIPRYRFSVKMRFRCFTMLRTQFPLRLAYSLAYIKQISITRVSAITT